MGRPSWVYPPRSPRVNGGKVSPSLGSTPVRSPRVNGGKVSPSLGSTPIGPPVSTGGRFRRALGLPPRSPVSTGGRFRRALGLPPSVPPCQRGEGFAEPWVYPLGLPCQRGEGFAEPWVYPLGPPVSTGGRFRRALHNAESQAKLRVPSIKHPGAMEWREPPARPYPEDRKTVADAWATHRVAPAMRIVWRAPVTAQQTGVDRVRDRVRVFPAARHARPSRRCAPCPPRR